jgi:excinuclease ABC subunit A
MVDTLYKLPPHTKITITFPWSMDKGFEALRKDGFFRIFHNNKVVNIEEAEREESQSLQVFMDSLTLDREERERLVDSLETAMKKGEGSVQVYVPNGRMYVFSSRLECKHCHIEYDELTPSLFSFNNPQGACPSCHGFGDLAVLDNDKIIPDKELSLEDGAIEPWTKPSSYRRMRNLLNRAQKKGIPTDVPFKDLTEEQQRFIFEGDGSYKGVLGFFERLKRKKYKVQVRVFLSRYRKYIPCHECRQMRLNQKALHVKIKGLSIGEVTQKTVRQAYEFFRTIHMTPFQKNVSGRLIKEIQNRLKFLLEVGLDYITLDRITFTLSGGEAQRINLASALSASLVGTLFVLDEPSIGLHARDNHRLIEILKSLKKIGNTVLVVEHDPEIIKSAEYLIDLGPGAGEYGGRIMFAGSMKEFINHSSTLTSQYMKGEKKISIPEKRRRSRTFITITKARKHNLKNIDIKIPLNLFTCVTGVSGSGKSTLIFDVLYKGWTGEASDGFSEITGKEHIDKIITVDQSPLSTSPRSIPATYTKAMDGIRDLFSRTREAKAHGYGPRFFSFNTSGGRCEACKGAGQQIVEMQFLSDVILTCDSCKGKRFKKEILDIRYKDKNIDEVLNMSASEACDFFHDQPKILKKLNPLKEVGLGYLRLGQPTTTLSGGELQRIKLAHNLVHQKKKRILYLFDEPTIGLHLHDVSLLLKTFQKLVNRGNTVVVIEHNLDMIKCADYIIDLGPEGGDAGGKITAQGSPEECLASTNSYTAQYLKKYLKP